MKWLVFLACLLPSLAFAQHLTCYDNNSTIDKIVDTDITSYAITTTNGVPIVTYIDSSAKKHSIINGICVLDY